MKNLLIAFLLAIFSVQGTVAAMGGNIAVPAQVQEQNACTVGIWSGSAIDIDNDEDLQVSLTIEELSDYVAFDLPVAKVRHQVSLMASLPVFLPSADLPRVKPPPRA